MDIMHTECLSSWETDNPDNGEKYWVKKDRNDYEGVPFLSMLDSLTDEASTS